MKKLLRNENLDTEINLVPIIDCFVILICFLLFTTTFTQLVFLQGKITSMTAAAVAKSRSELDKFHLTVQVLDNSFHVKASGSGITQKIDGAIPAKDNAYDFEALHQKMIHIKTNYPDRFSVDLEIKPKRQEQFTYKNLMKTMDSVRHLSDMEYSQLKTAEKKIRNIPLTEQEKTREIASEVEKLANGLLNSSIAANTEQKLLFPDIAIVGLN